MTKNIPVAFVFFAVALAWAASGYHVNFQKPAVVNGTEIKAGDYKLELDGNKAILKHGKTAVEADVVVETAPGKFASTSVCCLGEDGKYRLKEIRVGGTDNKVTFKQNSAEENSGLVAGK